MSFVRRLIEVTFELAPGAQNFSESGTNKVTLAAGLRVSAKVLKAGTPYGATLQLRIYGMALSLMNQLATLGMVYSQIPKNTITVKAGDEGSTALSTVFRGTILQAWIDFTGAPDVPFHIEAQTSGAEAVITTPPTSIKGSVDVAQVMGTLAQQMDCQFENNGITTKLADQYLYGPAKIQAEQLAKAAGVNMIVDNGVLAIWPKGGSRQGTAVLITPENGMVGYPTFTAYGILVNMLFNPVIKFGGTVVVKSSLDPVNRVGTWAVVTIDHDLEAFGSHGKWFTQITCYNPKFRRQVVQPQ